MHRTIELERRGVRRQAQRIALGVVGFAVVQAVFSRAWVEPYGTPVGQVVLTLFIATFLAAFLRLRALANPEQTSRFLTHPELVTDVASYRPRRMS
jgi:tight adherence protein B